MDAHRRAAAVCAVVLDSAVNADPGASAVFTLPWAPAVGARAACLALGTRAHAVRARAEGRPAPLAFVVGRGGGGGGWRGGRLLGIVILRGRCGDHRHARPGCRRGWPHDGLVIGIRPEAVVGIHAQGTLGDHHGRRGEDHDARAGSKWLTIRSRAG